MGRNVSSGSVIRAQADLFLPAGSVNRVAGLNYASLSVKVFFNNSLLPWPLADGTLTQDSSISAGTVYFNEVVSAPGFYAVRFFPDKTGFWRVVLRSDSLGSESVFEFDVSAPPTPAGGLNASFVK